jgi:hypothetical protein
LQSSHKDQTDNQTNRREGSEEEKIVLMTGEAG